MDGINILLAIFCFVTSIVGFAVGCLPIGIAGILFGLVEISFIGRK